VRREVDEDVATLRFSDGVEDVRCRCSAGHRRELYSHHGICQLRPSRRGLTPVMTWIGVRPRVRDDSRYAVYEMHSPRRECAMIRA
jgi:hypothetical protein